MTFRPKAFWSGFLDGFTCWTRVFRRAAPIQKGEG
jgi:hypothetical protein